MRGRGVGGTYGELCGGGLRGDGIELGRVRASVGARRRGKVAGPRRGRFRVLRGWIRRGGGAEVCEGGVVETHSEVRARWC
jgi:hypothetical protein